MQTATTAICQPPSPHAVKEDPIQEGKTNTTFNSASSGAVGGLMWDWDSRLKGARIFVQFRGGPSQSTSYLGPQNRNRQ